MKTKQGDKVTVTYVGTLPVGTVFDSTTAARPLVFIVGEGKIIPGFERAVEGMGVGEVKTVTIPVEQAYGKRDPSLVRKFPPGVLQGTPDLKKGMSVRLTLRNGGSILGVILEIADDGIVLDLNHPLSGQDLTFQITVLSIQSPPETTAKAPD